MFPIPELVDRRHPVEIVRGHRLEQRTGSNQLIWERGMYVTQMPGHGIVHSP
jgi:hypothetical protein